MQNDQFFVNPEGDVSLEAIERFQAIRRWHRIDTTRPQSIAEHSANVALLAYYVAMTAPIFTFSNPQLVLAAALVHDLSEVFTGDIPSHTKRQISGCEELEDTLTPTVFKRVEAEISESDALLIKLCDLADGIRFIRIYGCDSIGIWAMRGLSEQLDNKKAQAAALWSPVAHEHVMNMVMEYAFA